MLTLYIIKTHHKEKSKALLLNSLYGIWESCTVVEGTPEINEDKKNTKWYAVFFDVESVSRDLKFAMRVIMGTDTDVDAFIFMEKQGDKVFQSPRMFKRHVKLRDNGFMPVDRTLKFERVLDGWIEKWHPQ